MSASHGSVYTEAIFSVAAAIEAPGHLQLLPGSDITVALPGGTVRLEDGEVISFLTNPKRFFIQPGKKYLLVLSYELDKDFFSLGETWDLSSGTAKPNSAMEQLRAQNGRSVIVGRTEDDLISSLKSLLLIPSNPR